MATEERLLNKQRRKFLDMVAKAGVSSALWRASPLVGGAMINRYAQAEGLAPKRFIALSYPAGAPRGTFLPSSLTSMNRSSEPFLDVAEYCNFHELQIVGGGHGAARAALATGGSSSFDIQLSEIIGANSPYKSLHLGIRVPGNGDYISQANGQRITPRNGPDEVYKMLFAEPPPAGEAQKLYDKQAAALEENKRALAQLMSKLGAEEKLRFETHLGELEDLDKRLKNAATVEPLPGCEDPGRPSENAVDPGGNIQREIKDMGEIAINAMRCGLTNVIAIQLDDSQSNWRYTGSFTEGHHQTCHGRGRNDVVTITQYINEASRHLIKTLAETDDPAGGKMIDNTVFLQTTDQDGISHTTGGCPNVMATRMPGLPSGTIQQSTTNRALMADIAEGLGLGGAMAQGMMDDIRKNEFVV